VDLPDAIITGKAFSPIKNERLCWETGEAELSIKPAQHEFLEVFRAMEPTDTLPSRLEIPSGKGWTPPLVGIRLGRYTGSVRIVSMNSRSVPLEFDILYDETSRKVKIDF
jgi:hypothetical protein